MFIVTAKAPSKRRLLLLAAFLLAIPLSLALLSGGEKASGAEELRAESNEDRLTYLHSLGWEAVETPLDVLRLTLPEELVEPYRSYNELQLTQGFDLLPLLGETLERYTYTLTNYPGRDAPCQADLYVYDGTVVAGDVICTGADGFIAPLAFPAADDKEAGQ